MHTDAVVSGKDQNTTQLMEKLWLVALHNGVQQVAMCLFIAKLARIK